MTLSTALLRASHIGVRDLKAHLSQKLNGHKPLVVTEHGEPKSVIMPYQDVVELAEFLEELRDKELVESVRLSRSAATEGRKGVSVATVFKNVRISKNKS